VRRSLTSDFTTAMNAVPTTTATEVHDVPAEDELLEVREQFWHRSASCFVTRKAGSFGSWRIFGDAADTCAL